jgi:archaellum biogenesis ATPase FlaH
MASTTGGLAPVVRRPKFQYDRAFQAKMVRTLYQDPAFAGAVVEHLAPEHFEKRVHRWFCKHILDYVKKHGSGVTKDAIHHAVGRELKFGKMRKELAAEIAAFEPKLDLTVKDRSYVKEELHRFVKYQAYREAILDSLDFLERGEMDKVPAVFAKAISVQDTDSGFGTFYVRDVRKRTKARKLHVKNGVPTGLMVDEHFRAGGVPPGSLAAIVAPTGKGKSQFLIHFGKSAILEGNKKVLHITCELDEQTVCDRYDASFSGIQLSQLENKASKIRGIVQELGTQHGEFLHVKYFPSMTLTVAKLKAYIRQLERIGFYPDVVIVDYADEMLPTVMRDSSYLEMGGIYRELRSLAGELQIVIWTASQTSKGALTKEEFDIDAVADSFQKMFVCDLVLLFCQTKQELKQKRGRVVIGKSRLGATGPTYKLHCDWARSTIRAVAGGGAVVAPITAAKKTKGPLGLTKVKRAA